MLNAGNIQATEEPSDAMSVDEVLVSVTEGDNSNAVSVCSTTSTSNVSNATVVSSCPQQTNTATNPSGLPQTSKGVVIRPVPAASESSGKEYGFQQLQSYKNDILS